MVKDYAVSEKQMAQELCFSVRTLQRARNERILTRWFRVRKGVRYWHDATIAELGRRKRDV
ncbi:MAG: hypothetical protein U1E03_08520 [Hyphomonadaceae bacterium]